MWRRCWTVKQTLNKPARSASKCDATKLSASFQNKQLTTISNISCCQDDETAANRKTLQVDFPMLFVSSLWKLTNKIWIGRKSQPAIVSLQPPSLSVIETRISGSSLYLFLFYKISFSRSCSLENFAWHRSVFLLIHHSVPVSKISYVANDLLL